MTVNHLDGLVDVARHQQHHRTGVAPRWALPPQVDSQAVHRTVRFDDCVLGVAAMGRLRLSRIGATCDDETFSGSGSASLW